MWFEPIFAVLNKQTLSLYESENVNSLITSYLLSSLNPIAVNPMKQMNGDASRFGNKNMKCLELKDNQSTTQSKNMFICVDNTKEVENWKTAISEFHRCQVVETDRASQKKAAQMASEQAGLSVDSSSSSSSSTIVRMRQEDRQVRDNMYSQGSNELKDIIRNQEQKRRDFLSSIEEKYSRKLRETEEMLQTQKNI